MELHLYIDEIHKSISKYFDKKLKKIIDNFE
jgi:hypothetical protein